MHRSTALVSARRALCCKQAIDHFGKVIYQLVT